MTSPAASSTSVPLEGFIEYRWNLESSATQSSRKKPKLAPGHDDHDVTEASGESIPWHPEAGFYFVLDHHQGSEILNDMIPRSHSYLLSVPHNLLKTVCDAARFQIPVRVSDYTLVPINPTEDNNMADADADGDTDTDIMGRSNKKRAATKTKNPPMVLIWLLELHSNGFEWRSSSSSPVPPYPIEDCLSLQQVYRRERVVLSNNGLAKDDHDDAIAQQPKKPKTQRRYNVKGTVDSISPILNLENDNEPFALMELYDTDDIQANNNNSKPCSCLVVLQGKSSLLCHEGILPGENIQLRHAKRQQWKIPEEVRKKGAWHLKNRVPSHVFVVKDAKSVLWHHPNKTPDTTATLFPPMPSTPIPLLSLQGRVVSRKWASRGGLVSYMIHSVELAPLNSTTTQRRRKTRKVLFLLYYPMSPAMTLSLRPGALIQAVNIHCIGTFQGFEEESRPKEEVASLGGHTTTTTYYYGACLRSTITILQMPPPPHDSSSSTAPTTAYHPPRPFHLKTVQRSYLEYAYRQQLYRWYHDKNNFTMTQQQHGGQLPSLDDIFTTLGTLNPSWGEVASRGRVCARNPYLEFLDHACDDDHDEEENEEEEEPKPMDKTVPQSADRERIRPGNRCHCSQHKQHGPCWISLHKLRDEGIRITEERLASLWRSRQDRLLEPHLGWTGSLHLTSAELYQSLVDTGNLRFGKAAMLYTGGLATSGANSEEISVAGTTRLGISSASLQNDRCVLPATTKQTMQCLLETPASVTRKQSLFRSDQFTFAIGALHSVVISAICVGVASKLSLNAQSGTDGTTNKGKVDANGTEDFSRGNVCPLPQHGHESTQNRSSSVLQGACSLLHSEGLLFVLSIQLLFNTLVPVVADPRSERQEEVASPQLPKMTSNVKFDPPGQGTTLRHYTIQQCLDPDEKPKIVDKHNGCIFGLYVRQRLRLSKIGDNRYRGYVLTLSHIPIHQSSLESDRWQTTCMQTIDVKCTVHIRNAVQKRDRLKGEIKTLLSSTSCMDLNDAATLALAWWQMADDPYICCLAAGGWDDLLVRPSAISHRRGDEGGLCVVVELPYNAVQDPDARGYQRFGCSMTQIRARFMRSDCAEVQFGSSSNESANGLCQPPSLLTSIGGLKFLPGMLDRRPHRCRPRTAEVTVTGQRKIKSQLPRVGRGAIMELPLAPISGIPECRIVDLLRAICWALQNTQRHDQPAPNLECNPLAPSLVRRVVGARFLGASFCQAQAVCSKCFKPLCQAEGAHNTERHHKNSSSTKGNLKGWRSEKNGRTSARRGARKEKMGGCEDQMPRTFWHLPLPLVDMVSGIPSECLGSKHATYNETGSQTQTPLSTTLFCPNGCSDDHAAIKWECSGTLDDGTGQAKLYAEREAATMLLGLDQTTIEMIEEGVWRSKTGSMSFSNSVPPPSHLAKAVDAANAIVKDRENERQRRRTIRKLPGFSVAGNNVNYTTINEVLEEMDAVDRGCYLMIQECRKSNQTIHRMDFLVRCKPLADTAVHLNHTEVDVLAPGKFQGSCSIHPAATYSLPPLKLNLVDCSIASNEAFEETWDLVQSLKSISGINVFPE
jgi:hypothetical protein